MSDRYKLTNMGPTGFGRRGGTITPNDGTDLAEVAKGVVVTSAGSGNLRILPADNADGQWIDFVGVTVGFIPPYQVRRVGVATDCTVAEILDPDVG